MPSLISMGAELRRTGELIVWCLALWLGIFWEYRHRFMTSHFTMLTITPTFYPSSIISWDSLLAKCPCHHAPIVHVTSVQDWRLQWWALLRHRKTTVLEVVFLLRTFVLGTTRYFNQSFQKDGTQPWLTDVRESLNFRQILLNIRQHVVAIQCIKSIGKIYF